MWRGLAFLLALLVIVSPSAGAMMRYDDTTEDGGGNSLISEAVGLALLPVALGLWAAQQGLKAAQPIANQAVANGKVIAADAARDAQAIAASKAASVPSAPPIPPSASSAPSAPAAPAPAFAAPDAPAMPQVALPQADLPHPSVDADALVPHLPDLVGAPALLVEAQGRQLAHASEPSSVPGTTVLNDAAKELPPSDGAAWEPASPSQDAGSTLHLTSLPFAFAIPLPGVAAALSLPLRMLLVGSLLFAPILWLYHRVERSRVLANPRRRETLEFVKAHPGATAADVAMALGVFYNAARHHLDRLADHGLLHRRASGPHFRYFENHGRFTPEEEQGLALAARPESLAFLRLVAERPGVSQKDAALFLGLAKSTVCERVGALVSAALLEDHGGLRVTPTGAQTLRTLGPCSASIREKPPGRAGPVA